MNKAQQYLIGAPGRKAVVTLDEHPLSSLFDIDTPRRTSIGSAYRRNAWVRRCVDLRAGACSNLPCDFVVGGRVLWTTEEPPPDRYSYLKNLRLITYLAASSLPLEGAAYAIQAMDQGRPLGLKWVSPHNMEPRFDKQGMLTGFRRALGAGTWRDYEPEDVLYAWRQDPYTEIGPGMSEGDAARIHADVLHSLEQHLDSYFDRGTIRATLLTVAPETGVETATEIAKWWRRIFSGKSKSGATGVFRSGQVTATPLGEGLKDITSDVLNRTERESIAAAFGVPFSLVAPDAANYATKRADQIDFYEGCVIPEARALQDTLNDQYLSNFNVEMQFNPDRLAIYQQARQEKAETMVSLTGLPILTVNEARAELGREPVDGGDMIPVPEPMGDGAPSGELSQRAVQELAAWRRKAKKHGHAAKFEAKYLPVYVEQAVRERLTAGMDLASAFQAPYLDF